MSSAAKILSALADPPPVPTAGPGGEFYEKLASALDYAADNGFPAPDATSTASAETGVTKVAASLDKANSALADGLRTRILQKQADAESGRKQVDKERVAAILSRLAPSAPAKAEATAAQAGGRESLAERVRRLAQAGAFSVAAAAEANTAASTGGDEGAEAGATASAEDAGAEGSSAESSKNDASTGETVESEAPASELDTQTSGGAQTGSSELGDSLADVLRAALGPAPEPNDGGDTGNAGLGGGEAGSQEHGHTDEPVASTTNASGTTTAAAPGVKTAGARGSAKSVLVEAFRQNALSQRAGHGA